jgi:uncharacterized membrane protein
LKQQKNYRKLKKKLWITAISLLLLNILLKVIFISSESIAWDEPFSIYHAQMSVKNIIHQLYLGNNPPFFELILHFWIKMFGISPFSVRFLPMIFSSLTAVMIFLLGNKMFHFKVGLFTALLFTFSNFHLFFAHEARVYSLFGLLTVCAIYVFIQFIESKENRKYFWLLILLNALLFYTHYFGFFVFAIQGLSIILISDLRKQFFWKFVLSGVGVLLLFAPNLWILIGRFGHSASNGTWIEKPTGIESLYNMLWIFSNQPVNTVLCLLILVSALVKWIMKKDFKSTTTNAKIVIIWFLFPFLFMFGISFWIPIFIERYLIFVSFGYYFAIICSLDYLFEKPTLKWIFSGALILLFAATFKPNLDNKRHVREAVHALKELKTEETSVIVCGHDFVLNFAYYYDLSLFQNVDQIKVYDKMISKLNQELIYPVYSMPFDVKLKSKVIYFDAGADFSNPGNNILNSLNQHYNLKKMHHFEKIYNIYEFEKK